MRENRRTGGHNSSSTSTPPSPLPPPTRLTMADDYQPQTATLRMAHSLNNPSTPTGALSPPSPLPLSPEQPQTHGADQPPLVDALFASAMLNRNADPSHIDHYNTVVEAQALLHDLTTSNALDPGKKPPRVSRAGEVVDGPVPRLILQPTTVDDKERQVERFQMVRGALSRGGAEGSPTSPPNSSNSHTHTLSLSLPPPTPLPV